MEHFAKVPIVEAIIDFKINPLTEDRLVDLDRLAQNLLSDFPHKKELNEYQVVFDTQTSTSPQESTKKLGFRLDNEDRQKVIQLRLDGFTISHLPPYDSWETFSKEAKKLWEIYVDAIKPQSVNRVAVRYINRLDLPMKSGWHINEYLNILPCIPETPTSVVSGMFMQLQMPQQDIDPACMLVFNEAIEPPAKPNHINIVLDFDISCQRLETPWQPDNSEIWEFLEKLRVRKNEMFLASITEKTKALLR